MTREHTPIRAVQTSVFTSTQAHTHTSQHTSTNPRSNPHANQYSWEAGDSIPSPYKVLENGRTLSRTELKRPSSAHVHPHFGHSRGPNLEEINKTLTLGTLWLIEVVHNDGAQSSYRGDSLPSSQGHAHYSFFSPYYSIPVFSTFPPIILNTPSYYSQIFLELACSQMGRAVFQCALSRQSTKFIEQGA